jgi:metal-responsive CopG/Arc/MetJ family transcriptional regulator
MQTSPDLVRKLVSLPPDLVAAIDDFRFANRIKSQSEAIRTLLRVALDAAPKPAISPQRGKARPQP